MLPVEGRTVLDVVPPPSVSFVETLITVRSDLDPFLHAEALTYVPGGGGSYGGGGGKGTRGGGGGVVGGTGSGDVQTEGGAGSGFLTFGLSSWSCAVVGFAFLAVGLLLLVQPMFALRKWWKATGDGGGGGGGGGGVGGVGEEGRGGRGGGGRKAVGQWRYGQVETEW